MSQRIGACSLCGGDVIGFVGSWMSINPPPPARCSGCGALPASDVIPMSHPAPRPIATPTVTSSAGLTSLAQLPRFVLTVTNSSAGRRST